MEQMFLRKRAVPAPKPSYLAGNDSFHVSQKEFTKKEAPKRATEAARTPSLPSLQRAIAWGLKRSHLWRSVNIVRRGIHDHLRVRRCSDPAACCPGVIWKHAGVLTRLPLLVLCEDVSQSGAPSQASAVALTGWTSLAELDGDRPWW